MPVTFRRRAIVGSLASLALALVFLPNSVSWGADLQQLQTQLHQGKLSDAAASLTTQLKDNPTDQQANSHSAQFSSCRPLKDWGRLTSAMVYSIIGESA